MNVVRPLALSLEQESANYRYLIELHHRLYVGRKSALDRIDSYVQGEDRWPLVVSGPPGIGKTALLAEWCHCYATSHPNDLVLPCFVGATVNSIRAKSLIRYLCRQLQVHLALTGYRIGDDEELPANLEWFLYQSGRIGRKVVILIDELERLELSPSARQLKWLPQILSVNNRLILSSNDPELLHTLAGYQPLTLTVEPLTALEQTQLMDAIANRRGQALSAIAREKLVAHPGANLPLFCHLILPELLADSHDDCLNSGNFPDNISALWHWLLDKVENRYGVDLVRRTLSLVAVSRYGLHPDELAAILAARESLKFAEAWNEMWLACNDQLLAGDLDGVVRLAHSTLVEVIASRYLDHKYAQDCHRLIAGYFAEARDGNRWSSELPYHFIQTGDWNRLARLLTGPDFLLAAPGDELIDEMVGYWQSMPAGFVPATAYRQALDRLEKRRNARYSSADFAQKAGLVLGKLADYQGQIDLLARGINLRVEGSPIVAADIGLMVSMGAFYCERGQTGKAIFYLDQALAILIEQHGVYHPDTAIMYQNIAKVYQENNQWEQAIEYWQTALTISQEIGGENYRLVLDLYLSLGRCEIERKHYPTAIAHLQKALDFITADRGPDHYDCLDVYLELGLAWARRNDHAQAIIAYDRAVRITQEQHGPNAPELAELYNNLGILHTAGANYRRLFLVMKKRKMAGVVICRMIIYC